MFLYLRIFVLTLHPNRLEMTKVEVSLLFSTLDVNNDGKLQFQEFLEGMKWLNKGMNVATTRDKEAASSSAPTQDRASEMALQDALDSNKLLLTVRRQEFSSIVGRGCDFSSNFPFP
jgi:hypothetical protein